jgi:hypothetical protein
MSTFGTLISPRKVEQWLADFLNRWIEEYLAWYERENSIPARTLDLPWGIETSSQFTNWQGENLPHIVIASPGLAEPPQREADQVNACLNVAIISILGGADRGQVRENQMAYSMAEWVMIEQMRSLGRAEVRGANPIDLQFADIPVDGAQSFGSATLVLTVDVDGVISTRGLPPAEDPRPDPYVPDEDDPIVLHPGKIITPVERIS